VIQIQVKDYDRRARCRFASGADLGTDGSQTAPAHEALGFEETERVVYYRKSLRS